MLNSFGTPFKVRNIEFLKIATNRRLLVFIDRKSLATEPFFSGLDRENIPSALNLVNRVIEEAIRTLTNLFCIGIMDLVQCHDESTLFVFLDFITQALQ